MEYLVLARKFRPQTFEDVAGQEHVVKTLRNSIGQGRVAHAFLFSGPRGVGKTSVARILAKSLNCEKGPTATPCNECSNCREITNGSSLDVREIEAPPTAALMKSGSCGKMLSLLRLPRNTKFILLMKCICSRAKLSTRS